MNYVPSWEADRARFEAAGAFFPSVTEYLKPGVSSDINLAMDAQPTLTTTSNSGIPAFLTTAIDPDTLEIVFSPNKMATIFGEVKKGDWVDQTVLFPVIESTGEVASYGDFNEDGRAGANADWPQRQAYLYQIFVEWGELELERAGRAKIQWATQLNQAAIKILNKYQNLTYAFGVSGLQNYGALNDPALPASIQPGPKAYNSQAHGPWITSGVVTATPNEILIDIQSLVEQVIAQGNGAIELDSEFVLAMSPNTEVALTSTNIYGLNVYDMLKRNFPKMRIETAIQYGVLSSTNPQGISGGNLVQLIAPNATGQQTAYCAYNEKLRAHPVIRAASSFRQKMTQGSWGSVIRQPWATASMLGV